MCPTELGLQKFFVYVKFEKNEESDLDKENVITVTMNVIKCTWQISRITNDYVPYFGKLTMNKLFHYTKYLKHKIIKTGQIY